MATGPEDDSDPDVTESEREESEVSDREPVGETAAEVDVSSDERTWAILAHASAFAGFFVPFGNILAPLLVWLIKREESEFVDANGKQALNFQMTWTVIIVFALFSLVVGVGLVLVPIVALAWVILVVLATVRASENEVYDYPLTVDLVT
jgi:uncharacterized Tic20 family protein